LQAGDQVEEMVVVTDQPPDIAIMALLPSTYAHLADF